MTHYADFNDDMVSLSQWMVMDMKYVVLSIVTPAYIIVDGFVIEELENFEVQSVAEDTNGIPLWLVKNQSKQDSNMEDGGGRYNQ